MAERDAGAGELGADALREGHVKTCIYPGCERPVVGPHAAGGPPSAFCDREDHNALTAHQERQRLANERKDSDG